jgi:hypothetical protein
MERHERTPHHLHPALRSPGEELAHRSSEDSSTLRHGGTRRDVARDRPRREDLMETDPS